ncbi:hypothetical protein F2Q69_00043075 [Brassica cretica]|uniref:Uncharacterized protein n=1 Tax=Brassica cretica TaxID=69181 RepID=A0A8S9NCE2_BRACR|nr:hypothetical protein F2Q69_00043075 [Brassica cretica]
MNPCDYYQPEKEISSLQHVYNSTSWIRPQSPAHQRVPPCSLKHIDTSCSLQHIVRSTISSGHAPSRTDDFYHLQSYVLPELRAS